MQTKGIEFVQSKGFFGEDEGKSKLRVYTTVLIDLPQGKDEMLADIAKINAGENLIKQAFLNNDRKQVDSKLSSTVDGSFTPSFTPLEDSKVVFLRGASREAAGGTRKGKRA